MERLIDFLNHGLLPFTGRASDIDRLIRFWRGTFDAHELRAALLLGEAGIGKSRLLDETMPRIIAAGGAVVHAKLVPESITSLLPLIAQGLWYSEIARRLLKGEPEPTHAGVAGALRRISRLRPTLLVLEDIHLLAGDALAEFSTLLEGIAGETISVLCLARPVELPARGILERVLVEELELTGFAMEELAELWARLFDDSADVMTVARLQEATGGNPLALRAALRSAIKSKTIALDAESGRWRTMLDQDAFGRSLRRNVDLLVEGMAVHLTDDERQAAGTLAALGEVFTPESAAPLLPDAARTIEGLAFKGIIAPMPVATPILGAAVSTPFTFTHTLLHQYLASHGAPPVEELIRIVALGLPLYSTLPFQILSRNGIPATVEAGVLFDAVQRSIDVSFQLDNGPDWRLASEILKTGWHLFEALHRITERDEEEILEAALLNRTLSSLRRSAGGEEFNRHLHRFLDLTAAYSAGPMLPYRLRALHYLHFAKASSDYEACAEVWQSVQDLLMRAPELVHTETYLRYLEEVARAALRVPDTEMLRRVEERLTWLLASPQLSPALRATAQDQVARGFLLLFDSAEELESRLARLPAMPARIDGRNASLELNRIALLETIGRMEEALDAATRGAERFRQVGLSRNAAHVDLIALCARAALGANLDQIEREAVELGSAPGYSSSPSFRRSIGIYLTEVGLLCGAAGWARRIDETFGPVVADHWPEGELQIALDEGRLVEAIQGLPLDEEPIRWLHALGRALLRGKRDEAEASARALFERPLLRLDDLLLLRAAMIVIDEVGRGWAPAAFPDVLEKALAWLEERKLARPLAALLEGHGDHLPKKRAGAWRLRLRTLGGERPAEGGAIESRLRIGMIGTIAITGPDGRVLPIRGTRIRALLGLLVAAQMVPKPLTNREFCLLVAGGENDMDLARKTMNMAVVRLREAIGTEMVLTGQETHLLNLDRVSVDLLEAQELIREAREALRRRALMRAHPALLRVLRLTRGEVPFPGLYDDFFEAIRDDFESTLRTTVLDVAQALLRESDAAGAAEILQLAFEGMPEDEEIFGLLQQTLVAAGQRSDFERVRLRAEETLELAART